ncbi:MAG: NUDIX hydrolase [Candidatus Nanopelagicales bacterium]
MPPEVSARARALLAGEWLAPSLRDATTVILLRERETLETYLMRRASTMAFAAGMHVFPGGRVDEVDLAPDLPWVNRTIDGARMTASIALARGLIVCAVRELFEETGVLLAVDADGNTPREDSAWENDRLAINGSSGALGPILRRRGLRLDPQLLPLWTHWVTPEVESRRYDVRFFVAAVPPGQQARDVSGEADDVCWMPPVDALAAYGQGSLPMLPPTVATLADLTGIPDIKGVMAAAALRDVRPLMPRPRLDSQGEIAWDVIDVRDGSVMVSLPAEPAGSEVAGA